jgi:trehalose 6-phosphate phosphatase
VKAGVPQWIEERLAQAERLWLFLDYDGTLADFAPTPAQVQPDPELVELLGRLGRHPGLRVAVVSGRRLSDLQKLIPVPGVLLAGTYGAELLTAEGVHIDRLDYESLRPTLEALKPRWAALIGGQQGLFLEDKGWTLALHARFAAQSEADRVLADARRLAGAAINQAAPGQLRLWLGHRFLEIGPPSAEKGAAVTHLLDQCPWPEALPLFLGDDDRDEKVFDVVKARGGIAVLVAAEPRATAADVRLESPQAARRWLKQLLDHRGWEM